MPIPPDARRPSPREILAAVPTRFCHTMLRLMPYGAKAPTEYKDLQALAFWAVAKRRSVEQRVEALEAICALYDHSLGEMLRRWRLIEEIAQEIWIADCGFRVAEILLLARLDEISAHIEEEKASGVVVGIPTIRGGTTVLTAESPELRAAQGLLSEAVVQMSSRSQAELARLLESERLAAIRLLRLSIMLGRHDVRLAEQSAARLRLFRLIGKGLWNALKQVPLLHAPQPELYGIVAMNRIDYALSGEAGLEVISKTVRPKGAVSDAARLPVHPTDLDAAPLPAPGSSLMHVVVRGTFNQPNDSSERDILKRYEILRRPLPLAALPSIKRLSSIQSQLRQEFPWAVDAIEAVFGQLRARRQFGSVRLAFTPLLLCGPPGTGKTRLARRLGEVFDLETMILKLGAPTMRCQSWAPTAVGARVNRRRCSGHC